MMSVMLLKMNQFQHKLVSDGCKTLLLVNGSFFCGKFCFVLDVLFTSFIATQRVTL